MKYMQSNESKQGASNTQRNLFQKGFTLVEILITTAIMGIFAVMITPIALGLLQGNNQVVASAELQGIIRGAQRYRASNGNYIGMQMVDLNAFGSGPWIAGDTNTNIYGRLVEVTEAGAGADALLTYTYPTLEECLVSLESLQGGDPAVPGRLRRAGIRDGAACDNDGEMTFTIE